MAVIVISAIENAEKPKEIDKWSDTGKDFP
jgi:hypothetical protein